jgi:serine/threonine-protein kinase
MAIEDASAPPPAIPQPGDTIDGKYLLIGVIGTGGMGIVYEAEHLRLKQRCAIKMLSADMLGKLDILKRFEREARASALLKSVHVTRVTDVATTSQGVPYIVMELLAGHDLDAALEQRGRLPYEEAVDYVLQACAAVAEAHGAGIIHRDLKPGNLFLAQEPDGTVVKVLDFGISKMIEEGSKLTSAGTTMGTALYMSPEQLRSAATVDERSDIWSLGVILYELLCGEPPFVGSGPQIAAMIVSEDAQDIARRAVIPAGLAAAIARTMQRAPADRFARVADLAAALAPFAAPNSVGAAVTSQLARRESSRGMPAVVDERLTGISRGAAPVDVEARTIRDVSTGVAHEVNTAAGRQESRSRRPLAVLAVLAVVAVAGAAVGIVMLRRPPTVQAPPSAAGSASGVMAETATTASTAAVQPLVPDPAPSAAAAVSASASALASSTKPAPPLPSAGAGSRPTRPVPPILPTPATGTPGPARSATPAHGPGAKPAGGQSPTAPPFL